MINIKNGVDIKSNETIESILAQYKTDYIVQERITQSVLLTALYPNAINTFRVVTSFVTVLSMWHQWHFVLAEAMQKWIISMLEVSL